MEKKEGCRWVKKLCLLPCRFGAQAIGGTRKLPKLLDYTYYKSFGAFWVINTY